ncbi:MAG: carboxylating nicotinate-nucleotide diphosphorylase [Negativicutes bacterium]|nr:carboxylating nicotinate-nucleotide diphosphorylase [Negativicutes bacterium]
MYELTGSFLSLIDQGFAEDLGTVGDISVLAVFDYEHRCVARLLSKDRGVLAGMEGFCLAFQRRDPNVRITRFRNDGDNIGAGEVIAEVAGRTTAILTAERTAINILGFLTGIASYTARCVAAIAPGSSCRILDTRKTLPGYRLLSKYAVRLGGGYNHRMGLYDMVMLKDNHIDAVGSIGRAVEAVRAKWGNMYKIEVECRTPDDVAEAVAAGADWVMLDNMDNQAIAWSVPIARGRAKIEASGNMDEQRVTEVSRLGVDYISIGRLTHSVVNHDFSLQIRM